MKHFLKLLFLLSVKLNIPPSYFSKTFFFWLQIIAALASCTFSEFLWSVLAINVFEGNCLL